MRKIVRLPSNARDNFYAVVFNTVPNKSYILSFEKSLWKIISFINHRNFFFENNRNFAIGLLKDVKEDELRKIAIIDDNDFYCAKENNNRKSISHKDLLKKLLLSKGVKKENLNKVYLFKIVVKNPYKNFSIPNENFNSIKNGSPRDKIVISDDYLSTIKLLF